MSCVAGALLVVIFALSLAVSPSSCWTQDELDLFDLVEEIGVEENFYHLMQIDTDATSADVRRAYRQLSLQLHPDKSEDPNAAANFRKMVAVAEVLRDDLKREMYDKVLIEGLPDWKQPLFYYRRMRKMGLVELGFLLLLMASVAHYLYGWAVFAEKQIFLQDVLTKKQKKVLRKSKRSSKTQQKLEAEVEMLTTQAQAGIPHLKDLLPLILAKSLVRLLCLCWSLLSQKLESVTTAPPSSEAGDPGEEEEEEEEEGRERESRKSAAKKGRRRERKEEWEVAEAESKAESVSTGVALMCETTHIGLSTSSAIEGAQVTSYVSENSDEVAGYSSLSSVSSNLVTTVLSSGRTATTRHLSTAIGDASGHKTKPVESPRQSTLTGSRKGCGHRSNERIGTKEKREGKENVSVAEVKPRREEASHPENGGNGVDFTLEHGMILSGRSQVETNFSQHKMQARTDSSHHSSTVPKSGILEASVSSSTGVLLNGRGRTALNSSSCSAGISINWDAINDDSSFSLNVAWGQSQQTQLEWALTKYPKFSADRWLNVAKAVPGKSQEECIERCKHIYEEVKRKRTA